MQNDIDIDIETEGRPAGYLKLRADLLETHRPADAHERIIVEEFIEACWDLKCTRQVDH